MVDAAVQAPEDLAAALAAVRAVAPTERPTGVVAEGKAFNDTSGGGVRPQHAVDALEKADDFQLLEFQDTRMFIATKLIEIGRAPFVLLVIGSEVEEQWRICSAYRLYDPNSADLAKDACLAFQAFLDRYGMYFRAEDRWVLFVPVLTAKPNADGNTPLIDIKDGEGEGDWSMGASVRVNGDGTATVTWPFAVDLARYRDELKRHQN